MTTTAHGIRKTQPPTKIGAALPPLLGNMTGSQFPLRLLRLEKEQANRGDKGVELPPLLQPNVGRRRSEVTPEIRKAINRVITCRSPWPLTMVGSVGIGKTRAALCLLDAYGGGCIYTTLRDLCDDALAASRGEIGDCRGDRMNSRKFWHEWADARITVLDEIAIRENASDFQYECLKRALDAREGKPAIYISNLGLSRISDLFDDRVASRLAMGTVLALDGEDRRLTE